MNEAVGIYSKAFNLTTMAAIVDEQIRLAEAEQWSYAQFLAQLCEAEFEARRQRRIARLLKASGLPPTQTLDGADPTLWAASVRRILPSLLEGSFVENREHVLAFGLPGRGKTRFLQALCRELVLRYQYKVLSVRALELVERLLVAKGQLRLEKELQRLSRYDVVYIDELGYVEHRREEMEVFFQFVSARCEQGSIMLSSNQVFSEWGRIFKDEMMTMAAVERLTRLGIVLSFTNRSINEQMSERRKKAGIE